MTFPVVTTGKQIPSGVVPDCLLVFACLPACSGRVLLPPKRVFIMRGLPGAGKTTRAQQLADEAKKMGATAAIHSSDSYFTNPNTGVYR